MLGGLGFGVPPSNTPLSPTAGDHLGSTDQQQAGHPPHVARGPPGRQVGKVRPAPLGGVGVGGRTHGDPTEPLLPPRTPQHTASPRPPVAPSPGGGRGPSALFPSYAEQLRLAMALSAREQEEAERRTRQEEEDLQRILQLSLTEK